ncbi:MAG: 50S ribosomal protein L30 [Candidatus Dormibacteria bacterium]|jgi:large subunit ribosomal protein L30
MSGPSATQTAEEPVTDAGPALVRVTYRKSAIGYAHDQKATVAALGLRRIRQTVEHPDTPALRGMVHKVRHLVSVDGVPADSVEIAARLAAGGPLGAGAQDASTRRAK